MDLTIYACRCLVCRLLYLEVLAARKGNSDSMSYLMSIDAEEWAMMVGMERKDWSGQIAGVMVEWERNRDG